MSSAMTNGAKMSREEVINQVREMLKLKDILEERGPGAITPDEFDKLGLFRRVYEYYPEFGYRQLLGAIDELRNEEGSLGILRTLVARLDTVHADPAYKGVWFVNQLHTGKPYAGPTYTTELDTAREFLKKRGLLK
jgi:hypothetical protein